MKKWILAILISLLAVTAALTSQANPVLADSPGNVPEGQLQEYLRKYKYPYAEVPPVERAQLAQYTIKTLTDQIKNFQPGHGFTMTYLTSILTHMQELLSPPAQATIAPEGVTAYVGTAGAAPVAVNMIYYGWNTSTTDQRIVNAVPEFLVNNSPAGPWKGNANVSTFTSAGIQYFEYIDGGYEGRQPRSIPNDLQSNLNYITAAKQAGAYGIFLDEVSDGIWTSANYTYLQEIASYAHSLGLKVVFNTGMSDWSATLMNYCEYVNSSEIWQNTPLTTCQSTWASRTWLLTQSVTRASKAASLTEAAWGKGIRAHYACASYTSLPRWLENYITEIKADGTSIAPSVSTSSAGSLTATGATLNGNLTSRGSASSVQVSFEWGLTTSYGNATTPSTKTATGSFSTPISVLSPNTTYHFRAIAVGNGTGYGSDRQFTTTASSTSVEITRSIAAGSDDGFSGSGGYYKDTSWYEVGRSYNEWFRFTGITIPAGAVIEEAYLALVQGTWGTGTSLKIFAEDVASPSVPTSTADHARRLRTTTGISWPSGYSDWAWHNTPNFASVIQELVNSNSYNNGVIQILVDNNGSSRGAAATGSTFENSGYAPMLYIRYH